MNAPERIKPKTIRLAILLALADGAISTIDDLMTKTDEPRKKIANSINLSVGSGFIKRLRDDVTGGPAYQITQAGRELIALDEGASEDQTEDDGAERGHHQSSAINVLEDAMPGFTAEVVAQKDEEIARLTQLFNSAVYDLNTIADMLSVPDDEEGIAPIIESISELKATLESSRETFDSKRCGYIVKRAGKPLARFAKLGNAYDSAMSAARAGKRAQVFELLPVGAAVPGAEWVEA